MGISAEELAGKIGYDLNKILKIESGKINPPVDYLNSLSRVAAERNAEIYSMLSEAYKLVAKPKKEREEKYSPVKNPEELEGEELERWLRDEEPIEPFEPFTINIDMDELDRELWEEIKKFRKKMEEWRRRFREEAADIEFGYHM